MSSRRHKNIIGPQVRKLRSQRGWSVEELAAEFARQGIFISPYILDRVESRQESVGSIEVFAFAAILETGVENLYPPGSSASAALEELLLLQQNANAERKRRGFLESRIFARK